MNPGDVVLIPIPQFAGGQGTQRPALLLSILPGTSSSIDPVRCAQLLKRLSDRLQL